MKLISMFGLYYTLIYCQVTEPLAENAGQAEFDAYLSTGNFYLY